MSAHVSALGMPSEPNERIIYRDLNNNPTDKEHARYVVLQRFYEGTELLKEEIITDLKPEPEERATGFTAQLEASRGVSSTPTPEQTETEPHSNSEFTRMLEASGNGSTKTETVRNPVAEIIQRQMPTDFEYQLPEICNDTCIIKRHCSAFPSQVGSPCIKKMEQYRNDKFVGK